MELKSWEGPLPKETSESYHLRLDSYSSSQIKWMKKSPWHFKKMVIDGGSLKTKSMSFGSLSHELIHENLMDKMVYIPAFRPIETTVPGKREGTTKKHTITIKQQTEDFIAQNQDKIIITENEHTKIMGMYEAFKADKLVQSYIGDDDLVEQGFQYYDPEFDIQCRFRPDRISKKNKVIMIDYKSCANASYESFRRDVIKYGYDISAGHYVFGYNRLFKTPVDEYLFIAQETAEPYACAVWKLTDSDLLAGFDKRRVLLRKIKKYTKLNYWPGYTEKAEDLYLPVDYSDPFTQQDDHQDGEYNEAKALEQIGF